MKKKGFVYVHALVFWLMAIVLVGGQPERALAQEDSAAPVAVADALAALPTSDTVVFIDVRRLLSEATPRVLAANADLLERFNAKLNKFIERTKIDPSSFDTVAVGVRYTSSGSEASGVAIIQGRFKADEVVAAGLATAQAEGRPRPAEESYGGRTLYVVSSSKHEREAAFTVLNSNTIAVGDLEGTRAAIDLSNGSGTRVSNELVRLAQSTPDAIIGFSGRLPPALLERSGKGDNDFFGVNQVLRSIQQFYGSVSTTETTASVLVGLHTETAAQAEDIRNKLFALKQLSSFVRSNSPVAGLNILKNLDVTVQDREVQITLKQPLTEIANLLARSKSAKKE